MADHKLEINEGAEAKDAVGAPLPTKKLYRVTEQTVRESTDESNGSDGLFKNGQLYKPGDTLEMDEKTAQGFLDLGEVELVEEGEEDSDEGGEDA